MFYLLFLLQQYAKLHTHVMLLKHVSYVLQLRSVTGSYHHETYLAVCRCRDRLAKCLASQLYKFYIRSIIIAD
jgi:hypothetical protein